MMTLAAMTRLLAMVLLSGGLVAGCAPRPDADAMRPVAPVAGAKHVTFHVVTNRQAMAGNWPGDQAGRAARMDHMRVTVSVPPGHAVGAVEWSRDQPGPAHSFAVLARDELSATAFRREIATGPGRDSVLVFVHGYNTSLPDGVFRLAQILHDSNATGAAVLFSWPSQARISGYGADREAALFARDDLADFLAALADDPRLGQIVVLGHSMGGWLVMESLRQLRLTGQDRAIGRLQVVLAAPDIDIDVFRAQIGVIGPLDPPLTALVAADDGALRLATRLFAGRPRLGALDVSDPRIADAATAAGVTLIDIASLGASDMRNHNRYAFLAALYPAIRPAPGGRIAEAGAYVFEGIAQGVAAIAR